MRSLHLLGLTGAAGRKIRFPSEDRAPLVLPSWLSEADREILLAFYQQIFRDDVLPRVEIDWYRGFDSSDLAYLQHLRVHREPGALLVVVKVRSEGADLDHILHKVDMFEHVAVATDFPMANERFGRLGQLASLTILTAKELYEELAEHLSLSLPLPSFLDDLVHTIINPIIALEVFNSYIDLQLQRVPQTEQRAAIMARTLGRLLEQLSDDEVAALATLILVGQDDLREVLGDRATVVQQSLRHRALWFDEKPQRWAQFFLDKSCHGFIQTSLSQRAIVPDKSSIGKAISMLKRSAYERILYVQKSLDLMQIGRAERELRELEHEIESPDADNLIRIEFWLALGLLHRAKGELIMAKEALQKSIQFWRKSNCNGLEILRSDSYFVFLPRALRELAYLLVSKEKWSEEPSWQAALRLSENMRPMSLKQASAAMKKVAAGLWAQGCLEDSIDLLTEASRLENG